MTIAAARNCHDGDCYNDHTKTKKLSTRIQRLEVGLSFSIAGIILLASVIVSMSSRFQIMSEKAELLNMVQKSSLQELKVQQNLLSKKLAKLENNRDMEKVPNNDSKSKSTNFIQATNKQKHEEEYENNKLIEMMDIAIESKEPYQITKRSRKTTANKEKENKYTVPERLISRKLNHNSTECNATNSFYFQLKLDQYPSETRWVLKKIENENENENEILIVNQTYPESSPLTDQHLLECIDDGQYMFIIYDTYGDGLCSSDICTTYNISINDEPVIEGSRFTYEQSHIIEINDGIVCVGHKISIQINEIIDEVNWELIDTKSNSRLADQSYNIVNSLSTQNISLCVQDGVYRFISHDNFNVSADMKITVEGNTLVDGPLLSEYYFTIKDGFARECKCCNKPVLDPFNSITGNTSYDERTAELLDAFYQLSSYDDIHNSDTPQYKAACFILFDDAQQMTIRDELMVDRFVLYLFVISTHFFSLGESLSSDLCGADFVTCENSHIIGIWMESFALKGTIPMELGSLHHLKWINLFNNRLTGTIPTQLARLTQLGLLVLSNNELSGTIPPEIGKMQNLNILYLERNKLQGSIPTQIFDAKGLITLFLNENNITGTIPNTIYQANNLETLDFYQNRLTGTLPSEIGLLEKLSYLIIEDNSLTGTIPIEIGHMSSLWYLSLSQNHLVGKVPLTFAELFDIEYLSIDNNQLTGTLPDMFGNLTKLYSFYAHNNQLNGTIPESLWNVTSLSELQLQDNQLSGTVPDDFCNNMWELVVDDSDYFLNEPKVTCDCCEKICNPTRTGSIKCPTDNILDLEYYNISSTVTDDFSEDGSIEGGYIEDINANGTKDSFDNFCSSPTGCYWVRYKEKTWHLGYSHIQKSVVLSDPSNPTCDSVQICGDNISSDDDARRIVDYVTKIGLIDINLLHDTASDQSIIFCSMIDKTKGSVDETLEICDGSLLQFYVINLFLKSTQHKKAIDIIESKDDICSMEGIKCDGKFVTEINMSNANLTGTLISEIRFLKSLEKLDLSENYLTGTIHEAIFRDNLPNLKTIDLSHNLFEGTVPEVLLSHHPLKNINISSNNFIGTLPSNFSYSQSLESFDVADNLLLGEIPEGLFECINLHTIDISENNFEGTISKSFENLINLKHIHLNGNEIEGSIPANVFHLNEIEVLMLQSNKITGTIPSNVGNSTKITKLVLNHNSLEGTIPDQLKKLTKIEIVHLHSNQFIGNAPDLNVAKHADETTEISYITDCSFPFYALPDRLECKSCTMCCNSDEICKTMKENLSLPMWSIALLISILVPFATSAFFYIEKKMKHISCHELKLSKTYVVESTNSFILSNNVFANIVSISTVIGQVLIFSLYLEATIPNPKKSGVEIPYRCTENDIECINLNDVDTYSWLLFTFVMVCFVGTDIVMSINKIRVGIYEERRNLWFGGILLLSITTLALATSIFYCLRVISNDTDLIVNAVVLLFIIDLDERIFTICTKLFPEWTDEIVKDVESNLCND